MHQIKKNKINESLGMLLSHFGPNASPRRTPFFFLLISGPSVFIFSNIQLWPSEPVPADLFFAADPAIVPAPCIP
jgi:hypothetical protein